MARAELLIYDGNCAFCRWTLERGRAALPRFPHAAPYQTLDLSTLGLTVAQANRAVYLRTRDGDLHAGHRAVGLVLLDQPSIGWRLLGALALNPPTSWLADVGYRLVARHRGKLWRIVTRAGAASGVRSAAPGCST